MLIRCLFYLKQVKLIIYSVIDFNYLVWWYISILRDKAYLDELINLITNICNFLAI